jgi:hypothetical protein
MCAIQIDDKTRKEIETALARMGYEQYVHQKTVFYVKQMDQSLSVNDVQKWIIAVTDPQLRSQPDYLSDSVFSERYVYIMLTPMERPRHFFTMHLVEGRQDTLSICRQHESDGDFYAWFGNPFNSQGQGCSYWFKNIE